VYYIPRKDVDMARLQRTTHPDLCPYKANATTTASHSAGATVNAV